MLRGRFDSRDYRIDDTGPLADGLCRDQAIGLEVAVDWSVTDSIKAAFRVGIPANREIQLDAADGSRLLAAEPYTAPSAPFKLEVRL